MAEVPTEFLLYQAEDGQTRIDVRVQDETVWLNQGQLVELFQTTKQNISLHVRSILAEGELSQEATVKDYLTVQTEGSRDVSRAVAHYNLEMIIAIGFRVRSTRGTQFRQWAIARLQEYIVKGFAMDDERLSQSRHDYFDELVRHLGFTYARLDGIVSKWGFGSAVEWEMSTKSMGAEPRMGIRGRG